MENMKLKGHIKVVVKGPDGVIKHQMEKDNVIVTVGKAYLATWLAAASQAGKFMSYIGLGTGVTAANASDTTLETELSTRELGTLSAVSNVWQNVATFAAGTDTGSVSEAGLFTAASSGTMFARQVFTPIPKGADDVLEFTWTVTIS